IRGVSDGVTLTISVVPDGRIWTAFPEEGGPGVKLNDPVLPEPSKRKVGKKTVRRVERELGFRPGVDPSQRFPQGWRRDDIEQALLAVARNPEQAFAHQPERGRWRLVGTHRGVTITVELGPYSKTEDAV